MIPQKMFGSVLIVSTYQNLNLLELRRVRTLNKIKLSTEEEMQIQVKLLSDNYNHPLRD